ncbi:hypothetical protein FHL15_001228 [Xylaria flabelliformis]|uniref:Uncharacterized protein n=1 Tax=Xylaria flabelliformis TaxID=2512241 RepID=A0A553ICT6_9PEZI|nr:hypothetical protein FHL15_001228 [Xylaria flabelliformis]
MAIERDIAGVNFTSVTHHSTYDNIKPEPESLPRPFHVCILGASRDIGAHIAYSFAKAGATSIAICAPQAEIDVSPIPAGLQKLNPTLRFLYLPCDLTVPSEVEKFASNVRDALGHLDVLVYNAGYFGPWETRTASTPHDFSAAIDVNCKGIYLATHFMLPMLKKQPKYLPAIISVCSIGMHATGGPGTNTAYGISKLAQCRFIEMLAATEPDIFTAAVHPGNVKTEMGRGIPRTIFNSLPDDVGLCGDFIVWLVKERRMWLSGRYLSSNWDVDELISKRDEIVQQDKLKMRMVL